jgi:hypothetical protein
MLIRQPFTTALQRHRPRVWRNQLGRELLQGLPGAARRHLLLDRRLHLEAPRLVEDQPDRRRHRPPRAAVGRDPRLPRRAGQDAGVEAHLPHRLRLKPPCRDGRAGEHVACIGIRAVGGFRFFFFSFWCSAELSCVRRGRRGEWEMAQHWRVAAKDIRSSLTLADTPGQRQPGKSIRFFS